MSFPQFEAGISWHHFGFEIAPQTLGALRTAAAALVERIDPEPLSAFAARHELAHRRATLSVRVEVPTDEFDVVLDGVRRWLRELDMPAEPSAPFGERRGSVAVVPRRRWETLRETVERFDRWSAAGIPTERLRPLTPGLKEALAGTVRYEMPDDEPVSSEESGEWGYELERLIAWAVEVSLPPWPRNLGLGAGYAFTPLVERFFLEPDAPDPWEPPELGLAAPLVGWEVPRLLAFTERFGGHPHGGDELGPLTCGVGDELVASADTFEAGPLPAAARSLPELPEDLALDDDEDEDWLEEERAAWQVGRGALLEGVIRFPAACREIGQRGGAMVSFIGKGPD